MKKIFYIVLVIVALMVISRFVKQGNQTVPAEIIATEEVTPSSIVVDEVAVDENGNPIADEEIISEDEASNVEEAADIDEEAPEVAPAETAPTTENAETPAK